MIFENADTLYDSAKGYKVTPDEVRRVFEKHGIADVDAAFDEMAADLGRRKRYDAQAVLEWLGY